MYDHQQGSEWGIVNQFSYRFDKLCLLKGLHLFKLDFFVLEPFSGVDEHAETQ